MKVVVYPRIVYTDVAVARFLAEAAMQGQLDPPEVGRLAVRADVLHDPGG